MHTKPFLLGLMTVGICLANSANCPSTPTAISNSTIQAAPAGCTQVDTTFDLASPVVTLGADFTQSSSAPSDGTVLVQGTGVALGTGASAPGLIFSQANGFYGDDTSVSGYQGTGGETWNYDFNFSVTDNTPGEYITGMYFAVNNLVETGTKISKLVVVIGAGGDGFDEAFSTSGSVDIKFPTPVISTAVSLIMYTDYDGPSSFKFDSFQVGFDEATPEPSTAALSGIGLAALLGIRRISGTLHRFVT